MSIQNFIPTVWSARIQAALAKAQVFGGPQVVNRDYEGEIASFGDSVKIGMISDPTIKTYSRNTDIDTPEELSDAASLMKIDQGEYFNFAVDDVDRRQAQGSYFDEAMRRAAYKLRDNADVHIATKMAAGIDAGNLVGSSGSPKTISTSNESYSYLVDLSVELDEANVVREGRFAVVPPWYHGLLLKRAEFVATAAPQSQERLVMGIVGEAAGFTILVSNNSPFASTTYQVLAGVPQATTFAEQIVKTEAFRPERRFSDAVKGLYVYGAHVVRPEMLACLYVTKP